MFRRSMATTALAALAAAAAPPARAQAFPTRPVHIVVPFPPGGGTDVLVRLLTERLERALGQPCIVDNRPGATGSIGNQVVAAAAPDGYTLLAQATIISLFPQMMPGLRYDPVKDFAAIGMISETPTVFVVHPAVAARTLADLVTASKERSLTFGTAGVGSPQHLGTMGMARQLGMRVEHVPYRGTAPAVTDVLGRQLDFAAFSLSSVLPLIREGQLRAVAVHAPQRSPLAPAIPASAEQGLNDAGSSVRFLLLAPAGTPAPVVERLNTAMNEILRVPEVAKGFADRGYTVLTSTPAEAREELLKDERLYAPLVRELALTLTD